MSTSGASATASAISDGRGVKGNNGPASAAKVMSQTARTTAQVSHDVLLSTGIAGLERDDFSSNRHPALPCCWSMIFTENRYPLFGIMPYSAAGLAWVWSRG